MAQLAKYLSHHLNPYLYCRNQAWRKDQGAMQVFRGRRKINIMNHGIAATMKYLPFANIIIFI